MSILSEKVHSNSSTDNEFPVPILEQEVKMKDVLQEHMQTEFFWGRQTHDPKASINRLMYVHVCSPKGKVK